MNPLAMLRELAGVTLRPQTVCGHAGAVCQSAQPATEAWQLCSEEAYDKK
jgi:hypothetical protein